MTLDEKTLGVLLQRRKASITDQKILESYLKHVDAKSDERYHTVCLEILNYTRLGGFVMDSTEIDNFDERYQTLEMRLTSKNWIKGQAFPAEVGKSYRVHFGNVGQGFASAIVRVDSPAPRSWIDLETGAPLDPELAHFVVQAFIPLT